MPLLPWNVVKVKLSETLPPACPLGTGEACSHGFWLHKGHNSLVSKSHFKMLLNVAFGLRACVWRVRVRVLARACACVCASSLWL